MRGIVGAGGGGADVADGAAGADRVGDREAVAGVVEVGLADLGLGRDQVPPDADLGDDDVGLGEGLLDRGEAGASPTSTGGQ